MILPLPACHRCCRDTLLTRKYHPSDLDPLTSATGALRVIPGSHLSPFHEALGPIYEEQSGSLSPAAAGAAVPAFALETEPGDAVLFSQQTWHGAFCRGRAAPVRFFALGWMGPPQTRGQAARAAMYAERQAEIVAEVSAGKPSRALYLPYDPQLDAVVAPGKVVLPPPKL
eukprot:SAG22_NODE_1569_length_4097_cov_2.299400_2_plen_171_part_00